MGRHAGWRYYEADCGMYGLNPFVPLSFDNPTLGAFQQPVLKVNKNHVPVCESQLKRYTVKEVLYKMGVL